MLLTAGFRTPAPFTLFVAILCFLAPVKAEAHPHAWIDVSVKVSFDDQGKVVGLTQTWLFDEFYSMFVMEGASQLGGDVTKQDALNSLLAENMNNLAEYHYFSEVVSGEESMDFAMPEGAATREIEGRLEMSFYLPLQQPVAIDEVPLTYAIFDPTYYIEMTHLKKAGAIVLENAPSGCGARLIEPTPEDADVLYAASLGPSESGFDGLGKLFAERVSITCG